MSKLKLGETVVGTPVKDATLASRYNQGKAQLSFNMIGREMQEAKAKVWEYGAIKYSRGNWLKGFKHTSVADSALRHLIAYLNGEDTDPESGLPHLAQFAVNGDILLQMFLTRPDLDDRVGKEND